MDKLGDKGTQVRLSQGDGEVLPEVDGGNSGDEVDDLTMLMSVVFVMVIVWVMVMVLVIFMIMVMVVMVSKGYGRAAAAVVANVPVRATAGSVQNRTIAAKRDNTTSW